MNLPKNIIIVGGNGLVGSIIRKELAKLGSNIFSISRTEPDNVQINPFSCQVDARDSKAFNTVIKRIQNEHGFVTGLINCASYRPFANSEKLINSNNYDLWSDSILQNSLLLHVPTQTFVDNLIDQSISGSVVTITSIYGIVGPTYEIYKDTELTTEPDYAYNKAAAIGYTRYMSSKYAKKSIRFNALAPGGFYASQDPKFVEQYSSRVPLGRMAGSNDIASIVALLLSEESSYITGTVIPIDGGWTAI